MNELHKEVKKRLELVSNRLIALEKEQKHLNIEQENLQQLDKLYDSMHYDSITEERRVTDAILHSEPTPKLKVTTQPNPKGISQYDLPIEIIFTTYKNPLDIKFIHQQLEILSEKKLNNKNVDQIVRQQSDKGKIIRTGRGAYKWIGGTTNADIKTLSDRGCSET